MATATKSKSKTKLVPLADRLVVQAAPQEEVLASGLVIPDTAQKKPRQGVVIAVGPGRMGDDGKRIPIDIAVGDRVLYANYGPEEITIDQEEFLVLSEKDVLCKIN
jgi:chaperonin GroES